MKHVDYHVFRLLYKYKLLITNAFNVFYKLKFSIIKQKDFRMGKFAGQVKSKSAVFL